MVLRYRTAVDTGVTVLTVTEMQIILTVRTVHPVKVLQY